MDGNLVVELLFPVAAALATWLKNRRDLQRETQTVRDVLQISGQDEVFRIENLEQKSYEYQQEIKILKAALFKTIDEIENLKKSNEQKKPDGI